MWKKVMRRKQADADQAADEQADTNEHAADHAVAEDALSPTTASVGKSTHSVKPKCHACATPPPAAFPLTACRECEYSFCPAKPCYFQQQTCCKKCVSKLLQEVIVRQDQDKWWLHTAGDKHLRGYQANRRALQDLLEGGIYLRFDENGLCTMFYEKLSPEEMTEGLRLMGPITNRINSETRPRT